MATIVAAAGGGNWTTGGTWVGGVAPSAADDAQLASTSGNVTIDSGAVCRSLDCTGYTGTLTHNAITLNVGDGTAGAGNIALKFVAGMTYTLVSTTTSAISFVSTSATQQTIATGTKTMGNQNWNGTGSSYLLSDDFTATAATLTLNNGTLNTNSKTISCVEFNSNNTNTRTLTLGASAINYTTNWWFPTTNNLTFSCGTSTLTQSGSGSFNGGSLTYNLVIFLDNCGMSGNNTFAECRSSSSGNLTISGSNTFGILRRTNTTGYPKLYLGANQTVTGTLELTGNNANSQRLLVCASDSENFSTGVKRTITSNGTNSLTNVDFLDITGAGTASWSGTSIGNCGNNSGITFTTPVNRYWVGNGGNYYDTTHWSTSTGGASGASMPLPQDSAFFDANSFSLTGQTVDMFSFQRTGNIDFSAATNTPKLGHGTFYFSFYGNLVFKSAMTIDSHLQFMGRGSHTITMGGFSGSTNLIVVDAATGTYTLQDDFIFNTSWNWLGGNITATTQNVSLTGIFFNGSNTRTITMGSGTWTLSSTSPWTGSSFGNVTINSQTSTIKLTANSASNSNFGFSGGGPFTYNKVWVATAGAGVVIFAQTAVYTTFQINAGCNVRFTAGTTNTITNWSAVGNAGNLITIDSTSAGTAATLSKPSGTVACDYLSLQDSAAGGGAAWYAGSHSTNVSGNSGWIFSDPPVVSANVFFTKAPTLMVTR